MQQENNPKNKTKIVYIITKGVWGGAQKYVFNLATSLSRDNYDVTVICGEGKILKEKLEEKEIKVLQMNLLKRDISILGEIASFLWLFNAIRKIKPDVIHLNSPKAGGLGVVIGRMLRVPKIIYTVHGFAWNEDRPPIHKILITIFTWITILLAHKTITISTKEEDEAKKLILIKSKKIELIRNGVEKIDFMGRDEARNFLEEKIGKKIENKFCIGTISELHKNKGLEYAISAVSKIKTDFLFIVLGGGELEKPLKVMIEKYEMKDKVFLVGFVENASKYLKAFDLFTLTSIKEGLPYTVIEAGLSGVPVIASNIGGIPDIVDNGKNGILVTKGKPGEITRAIEYMIENKDEREKFTKNLKDKMENNFSLESMLQKTTLLYTN